MAYEQDLEKMQEKLTDTIALLVKCLHPGAIGLISKHHGYDRGNEAIDAVNCAKLILQELNRWPI